MGLIILTGLGAILGWLAAIARQAETRDDVVSYCGAGVIGAILAGVLTNRVSLIEGVSGSAVLMALVGAITAIILMTALRAHA